jgi:hypothetical protein
MALVRKEFIAQLRSQDIIKRYDDAAGRAVFKNDAGLLNNSVGKTMEAIGRMEYDRELSTDPAATAYHEKGYAKLGQPFDDDLIDDLAARFDELIEDEEYSFPRAEYGGEIYSHTMKNVTETMPEFAELITDELVARLENILQTHFEIPYVVAWRNKHVPPEIREESEIFSDRWHCDAVSTDITKLFVYLTDVTEHDGPFNTQSRRRTQELTAKGYYRGSDDLPEKEVENPEYVQQMTGPAGTALICNTPRCFHRAGVPAPGHHRDIVQFHLAPSTSPLSDNWIENVDITSSEQSKTTDSSGLSHRIDRVRRGIN